MRLRPAVSAPTLALTLSFSFAGGLTVTSTAAAQLVADDDSVDSVDSIDSIDSVAAAPHGARLLDVAGPAARVVRTDDGFVRILYGAHITGAGERAERAVALVERFAHELGMPTDVTLAVEGERETHGFTIVRLARHEAGLRVRDAGAVVRFLSDGAIDLIVSSPGASHLAPGAATLTEARARELASADGATVLELRPELFSTDAGLVPVMALITTRGPETTLTETVLDARDGSRVFSRPLALDALGTVFARNRTSDMAMTSDVTLTDLTSTTTLTGTYFEAINCAAAAGGCAGSQAVADAAGDFLFAPVLGSYTDAFAEVSAYHHASRVAAYMRAEHGFNWSCSGVAQMELWVNYTEAPSVPYDNAAFSPGFRGRCGVLLFGQGVTGDFAWDGDVVYHEFGHAVTDQVTDISGFFSDSLGVSYEPLAVNEGTSDYWAGAVQGDGSIAESFSGLGGIGAHGSLRIIDGDLTCPGSLIGEGHADGRLWAGLGWQMRTAIGPTAADALFFATVASTDSAPSLSDVSVLYRATAMGMMTMGMLDAAAVAAVDAEIAARGLEGCRRIQPLDDLLEHQGYSGTEFLTAGLGRGIAPLHFSLAVPVDATSLSITLARQTFAGNYRVHLRVGSPVRVASRVTSTIAVDVGSSGTVVVDPFTALPLPRCETLYVAVEAVDLGSAGQSLFGIQAMMELSGDPAAVCPALPDAGPPPGADAGPPDAGPAMMAGGGSCSCAAAGEPGGATVAPGLLLLALAALVRSKRLRARAASR